MNNITPEEFKRLLPLACEWAERQEQIIIDSGVSLNNSQIKDAERIGVNYPERVKLLKVSTIPVPEDPTLADAARAIELITPDTHGLTLRYGIFIHSNYWKDRKLLVHELVHTFQYEKLGGLFPFLEQYLHECITIGYPDAPMEQEAIRIATDICT